MSKRSRRACGAALIGVLAVVASSCRVHARSGAEGEARGAAAAHDDRQVWLGPDLWANRLQDWRRDGERIECIVGVRNKPMRTVHSLTRSIAPRAGSFRVRVRTGVVDAANRYEGTAHDAATGFLFGVGGGDQDWRSALLVHNSPGPGGGWFAGVDGAGRVFLRDFESPLEFGAEAPAGALLPPDRRTAIHRGQVEDVTLALEVAPSDDPSVYVATVVATRTEGGEEIGRAEARLPAARVAGGVALVSHPGGAQESERYWFRDWTAERQAFDKWASGTARFWFEGWEIEGDKIDERPERELGPILSSQYTLHEGTLHLTAQLFPVSPDGEAPVRLESREGPDSDWRQVATTEVVVPGYTATFRVGDWPAERDVEYRVVGAFGGEERSWGGTIARDPEDERELVVAAFTGDMMVRGGYEYPLPFGVDGPYPAEQEGQPVSESNTYLWDSRVYFPHAEVTRHVAKHEPDLLFFSGDQVYEGNPTRAVESPVAEAHLDYLYKWYLWCWTWRDLTRRVPTVTIPDDHDVYQRNIWGDGGEFSPEGDLDGSYGGYFMDPEWINMIQRTQTSHLPPRDEEPAKNGIEVYFTSLTVGRVGFAVVEDRKFKSFPSVVDAEMSRDSHITQSNYDTREADVAGATLLGERQLAFLDEFAADWRGQDMKALLSQTIFANLQILNPRNDGVPQEFEIPLDRDLDSNGWPQTGRRRALEAMRRGYLVHIAGDQHLASVIHHGTEAWEDACWSFCVPSVANYYARSWNPKYPPVDPEPSWGPYTGRYEDGFHNKLTVRAVANPDRDAAPGGYPEPVELHAEMPGYGIVRFDKEERSIRFECWPRYADPADPATGGVYEGWPVEVAQRDNYARAATHELPEVTAEGIDEPVVQVIHEATGEMLYALRLTESAVRPWVFGAGTYTVRIGDPDTGAWREHAGLEATPREDAASEGR